MAQPMMSTPGQPPMMNMPQYGQPNPAGIQPPTQAFAQMNLGGGAGGQPIINP